ncbi:MAG: hypothetical protein ACFCVD_13275 [Nodosilinea sp.]
MNNTAKTDWAKIDAMTDDDIDTSDIPPLSETFFAKAKLKTPQRIRLFAQWIRCIPLGE